MKDGVPDCQTTCKDEKDNDSESNQHDSHGVGGEKAKQFGPSARQLLTVYDKREDGSMHKTFTGPSARRLTAYDEEEHEATAFMSDPNGENDLQVGDSWSPYEAAKNAKIKVPNPFADRRRRAKTPPPPKPPPHKCRMFEYKPRKKGFLPKLPVGPPPPPMVPPNPAHCGGDPSLKQPAATKAVDLANNAAKMAAAAAEPPPPPPQHYKKGEFAGDKEIVKFNHATFNSEDIVGGCQIASETGRRKIEISVVKLGKTALADINFTFMKMTVCKHKTCERRAEILDCSIQYKTFNLEKPEDPPKLEAKEDCDDAAVDAATAAT